ncbi:hypothetical protein LGV61_06365 [Desulfurispirillum indicum]|uniref:hypothetical protein n=1 Tax=Desulfurispirillum indicum TaxID=936456 RepID=UPI001CFB836A|nr:hypothetical protein [Desulfurispirillum indicum]UCZ57891.1 hypothetical protein LGV61_06365 [Desulfurispirillum indicum]
MAREIAMGVVKKKERELLSDVAVWSRDILTALRVKRTQHGLARQRITIGRTGREQH